MKLRTKLRPYQRAAVEKAKPHAGFLISSEPRTGKTLIGLALAAEWNVKKLVVICPKQSVKVWHSEVEKHVEADPPEMKVVTFATAWKRRRSLIRWSPDLVIVDESHRIKERTTKASRAAWFIGRVARKCLALTGTPIGEGYEDLWAQFRFFALRVWGDNWKLFQRRYLKMGGFRKKKVVGYRLEKELKRIVHENSYRTTLDEARGRVCRTVKRVHRFGMSAGQKYHYDMLETGLVELANGAVVEAPRIITQIQKMQQVTGGWVIPSDRPDPFYLGSSKFWWFQQQIASGERLPMVVVCRYIHELEALSTWLEDWDLRHQVIRGGQYDMVPDFDVTLIQAQAGVSIDLSRAKHLVFYSWDYSALNHGQMSFRIASYSSTKISYDYLVVADSIDEVLLEAVTKKQRLAKLVIDKYRRRNT